MPHQEVKIQVLFCASNVHCLQTGFNRPKHHKKTSEFKQNIWDETISIVTPDYSISEVTEYLQSVYSGKNLSHFSILNSLFGCFYTEKDELEVQIKEEKEDFDIGIGDCDTFENVNLDDDNHDVDEDIKTEEKVVISLKV